MVGIADGFVGFVGGRWLVVGGSGFVGFVNAIALLVVDGFVGFVGGRWLVVLGLWVLLSWVVGFMGSVQFFLLL